MKIISAAIMFVLGVAVGTAVTFWITADVDVIGDYGAYVVAPMIMLMWALLASFLTFFPLETLLEDIEARVSGYRNRSDYLGWDWEEMFASAVTTAVAFLCWFGAIAALNHFGEWYLHVSWWTTIVVCAGYATPHIWPHIKKICSRLRDRLEERRTRIRQ